MKEMQDVYEHLWRNKELFTLPESKKGVLRVLQYVAGVQQSLGADWDAFDTYTMCLDIDPSREDLQQHIKRLQSKMNDPDTKMIDSDIEKPPKAKIDGIVSFIFEKSPPAYLNLFLLIHLCLTISLFGDFFYGRAVLDVNVFSVLWCIGWICSSVVVWCKFEFENTVQYDSDLAFHQEKVRSLEKILNRMVNRHMED
jgi:hypothetical protein